MNTLITSQQLIQLAFADSEYLPPELITQADIIAAGERYILPIVGQSLYTKLLEGGYPQLLTDYVAAPVALCTRLLVQPCLNIRAGACGTTAPRSAGYEPATQAQLEALIQALHTKSRTLLRRLSHYLEAHAIEFPEYNAQQDVTNHCSIDGNIVQIF